MLFDQAPGSASRRKHRWVCYPGPLAPATNGHCAITARYTARYGQPSPGQKVFLVTCQVNNGWKAQDHLASAIVPPRPLSAEQQSTQDTNVASPETTVTPESQVAATQAPSPAPRAVYKGSTPDAPGLHKLSKHGHPLSTLCAPLVHGLQMALGRGSPVLTGPCAFGTISK
jgi:hypothetical protein